MVRKEITPKEALDRMKLMMEYDSSKTLSENLNEQERTSSSTSAWKAAATGAATGAAIGGAATAWGLGIGAIPGAIGGALLGLATSVMSGGPSREKCKELIDKCISENGTPKLAEADLGSISDKIYDAVEGIATDEESIANALKKLPSMADFCKVVKIYNNDNGDLFEALDEEFESDGEWNRYFQRALRGAVEGSTNANQQGQQNQQGGQQNQQGGQQNQQLRRGIFD